MVENSSSVSGRKPILFGCAGTTLTKEEQAFFAQARPLGFILFRRNCESPEQVRALTASLRETVGWEQAPLFVDQEGGRVARLKQPPHWPALPAMQALGKLYEKDAAAGKAALALHCKITSAMLRDVGIDGNFAPVLDLWVDGASDVIGDRAFSSDPESVAACGRVVVESFLENGILPVIKHMPGHGRVKVDPHVDLPFVDTSLSLLREKDFVPFQALKDAPAGMNCHVVFRAIDPELPVSLSRKAHEEILRGDLGFQGLIFSDDLAMGALSQPLPTRAQKALEAGADILLYCSGILEAMREVAESIGPMSVQTQQRWEQAQKRKNKDLPPLSAGQELEREAQAVWDLIVRSEA